MTDRETPHPETTNATAAKHRRWWPVGLGIVAASLVASRGSLECRRNLNENVELRDVEQVATAKPTVPRSSPAITSSTTRIRPAPVPYAPDPTGFRRYDLIPCQVSVAMPCEPTLKLQGNPSRSGKPQSFVYLANCGAVNFGITCSLNAGGGSRLSALETNHRLAVDGVSGATISNASDASSKQTVLRSMQGLTSIRTRVFDSGATISLVVAPSDGLPESMLTGVFESLRQFDAN